MRLTRALVDHGANVEEKWGAANRTPLHLACELGHVGVVRVLLKKGAQVSSRTLFGLTPLHVACERGLAEVVRVLLQHGASLGGGRISRVETPLHIACWQGNTDVVKLLLQSGADANASWARAKVTSSRSGWDDATSTWLWLKSAVGVESADVELLSPLDVARA